MTRKQNRTIFSKIIKEVNGFTAKKIIDANNGDKFSKVYSVEDQLLSQVFMQLNQGDGLRDSRTKYDSSRKLKKEFKMPSVSQLSRMNASKSPDIFREIFLHMLYKAKKELKKNQCASTLKNIKIIDSTVLTIGKGLVPELYMDGNLSAVRISTQFNRTTETPDKIIIVPGKVGERNALDGFIDDHDSIYLFDRGYYKYKWYDEMTEDGYKFVTRQQTTAVTEEYKSHYTGIDNLYDYEITMGTDYSKNKTEHKYREILYFKDDSDEEFRLVTNIFDLTAEEIVSLYKMRWDIECFFKWIKQHLTIKKWCGHNLNAITIQIYCALIVYLLLIMIKTTFKYKGTLYNLLRNIRMNLLEMYAIRSILT
jgi:hypothetical protein